MPLRNLSHQPVAFGRRQPAISIGELRTRIDLLNKRIRICRSTPRGHKHAQELESIARGYEEQIRSIEAQAAEYSWAMEGNRHGR